MQQTHQKETLLHQIVRSKMEWLKQRQQKEPLATFHTAIRPSERDFYQTLQQPKLHFILECKKASPSKGVIRADFDPQSIARIYRHHASVISVLTDAPYFQGDYAFLPLVSAEVTQPVLCKDFIIDPYQIYLARHYQADAVLLMLSVLKDDQYRQLAELAHSLQMGVLTEVSNEEELERAIALRAKVVGINNRDLRDLGIDLQRTCQLAPRLPKEMVVISESGIYRNDQIRALSRHANGFLIGSSLMAQQDLQLALNRLLFGEHKVCGLTRAEDAAVAYQAGAVYGGLIFVRHSPRCITLQQARQVMSGAPLNWVGVFANESIEQVSTTALELALSAVQLHGGENAEYVAQLRKALPESCRIWYALHVTDRVPACSIPQVDRYLLDAAYGGSGKPFDWQLLSGISLENIQLAGGINEENLSKASQLGCAGLDINSGVESAPGIKDHQRLKRLFSQLNCYQYPLNTSSCSQPHST